MLVEHLIAGDQLIGPENDLQALEELCKTTSNESQRSAARRALNQQISVRPGNSQDRGKYEVSGSLRDFSSTGCGIFSERPLMVGDIFWLEINSTELGVGSVFARCVRCRLVSEGKFDHGFAFFNPVKPRQSNSNANSDLL